MVVVVLLCLFAILAAPLPLAAHPAAQETTADPCVVAADLPGACVYLRATTPPPGAANLVLLDTDALTLDLTVLTPAGNSAGTLTTADFLAEVQGVQLPVITVERTSPAVSVLLLVDLTDTMSEELIQNDLIALLGRLRALPGAEVAILTFSDAAAPNADSTGAALPVFPAQGFSSNFDEAEGFLRGLTERRVGVNSNVLVDATLTAVERVSASAASDPNRQYVILTITDATDTNLGGQESLLNLTNRVPIFTIALPALQGAGDNRPNIDIPRYFAQQTGGVVYVFPAEQAVNLTGAGQFLATSLNSFSSALNASYRVTLSLSPLRGAGIAGDATVELWVTTGSSAQQREQADVRVSVRYTPQQYALSFSDLQNNQAVNGVVNLALVTEPALPQGSYSYQFLADGEALPCSPAQQPTCAWDTSAGYPPGLYVVQVGVFDNVGTAPLATGTLALNLYSTNLDVALPAEISGQAAFTINTGNFRADTLILYAAFDGATYVEVARIPASGGSNTLTWNVDEDRPAGVNPGDAVPALLRVELRDTASNLLIARWDSAGSQTVRFTQDYTFSFDSPDFQPMLLQAARQPETPLVLSADRRYSFTVGVGEQPGENQLLAIIIATGGAEQGFTLYREPLIVGGETALAQTLVSEFYPAGRYAVGPAILRLDSAAPGGYRIVSFEPYFVDIYTPLPNTFINGVRADSVNVATGEIELRFETAGITPREALRSATLSVYAQGERVPLTTRQINLGDEIALQIDLETLFAGRAERVLDGVVLLADVRSADGVLLARWSSQPLRVLATPSYAPAVSGFRDAAGGSSTELSGVYTLTVQLGEPLLTDLEDELVLVRLVNTGELRISALALTPTALDERTYQFSVDTAALNLPPGVHTFAAAVLRRGTVMALSDPITVTLFRRLDSVTLGGVRGDVASGELQVQVSTAGYDGASAIVVYMDGREVSRQPVGVPIVIDLDSVAFTSAEQTEGAVSLRVDLLGSTEQGEVLLARWTREQPLTVLRTPAYAVTLDGVPGAQGAPVLRQPAAVPLTLTANVSTALLSAMDDRLAIFFVQQTENGTNIEVLSELSTAQMVSVTLDMSARSPGVYRLAAGVLRQSENGLQIIAAAPITEINFYAPLALIQVEPTPRENSFVAGEVRLSVSTAGLPGASFAVFSVVEDNVRQEIARQQVDASGTALIPLDVQALYFSGTDQQPRPVSIAVDVYDASGTVLLARGERPLTLEAERTYTLAVAAAAGTETLDLLAFPEVTRPLNLSAALSPVPPGSAPLSYGFFLSSDGGQNFAPLPPSAAGASLLDPTQLAPGAYVLLVTANVGAEQVGEQRYNLRLVDENNRLSPTGVGDNDTLRGSRTLDIDNFSGVAQIVVEFLPQGGGSPRSLGEFTPVDGAVTPVTLDLQSAFYSGANREPFAGALRVTLNDADGFPLYRWSRSVSVVYDDSVSIWLILLVVVIGVGATYGVSRVAVNNLRQRVLASQGYEKTNVVGDMALAVLDPNGRLITGKGGSLPMAQSTGRFITIGRRVQSSLLVKSPDIGLPTSEVSLLMGRVVVQGARPYFIAEKKTVEGIMYNNYPLTESPDYDARKRTVPMRLGDELGFGRDGRWRIRMVDFNDLDRLQGLTPGSTAEGR